MATSSSAVDRCADVTRDGDGLGPGGGDLVDDIGLVQRAGHVVDHDGRARSREPDGLCAAKARGRAGHHRDQAGQISRVVFLCESIYEYL